MAHQHIVRIFEWFKNMPILDGDFSDMQDIEDLCNILMSILCVVCAGLASGLTMGMVSLDFTKLKIKTIVGTPTEKAAAHAIIPIIKRRHFLLVTLLLFNSLANESLPIFLGALVPNYIAVLISVFAILIFGEIIPSAIFTGSNQLEKASGLTGLVNFLMLLFYPLAYPIGKVLDFLFGDEEETADISREEFGALMQLQAGAQNFAQSTAGDEKQNLLSDNEIRLFNGILELSKVSLDEIMIPMSAVFTMDDATILNKETLEKILASGFSRIPIHQHGDAQNLLGYLLVKGLVVVNPQENRLLNTQALREPLFFSPQMTLRQALAAMTSNHVHMAFVCDEPLRALRCLRSQQFTARRPKLLGMVTLEDVMERVLQNDIIDETDSPSHPTFLKQAKRDSATAGNNSRQSNASPSSLTIVGSYNASIHPRYRYQSVKMGSQGRTSRATSLVSEQAPDSPYQAEEIA